MDVGTALRWTAERYPHRRAVGGESPLTYAQWDARTSQLARALAARGVRPGQRVVLLLAGGEPLASLHLATQKLGAVSVPLSFRLGPTELAFCIENADPAILVADESTSAQADAALAESGTSIPRAISGTAREATLERDAGRESDAPLDLVVSDADLSVMLYTAGTTGKPKGVPRTHDAEHTAAVAHLLQTGQEPFEATLGAMPLFHTMGLRSLLATIVAAGTWVPQARFDAERALELITTERIGALYLVPTIYWSLVRTGRLGEARSVRKLAYAGAAMTPALAEQLADTLVPDRFVNHYGSTEIYTFTIGPDVVAKPGCAGRAGLFSRVRLVDPAADASPEDVVEPGQQGQVAISMRSPEAFTGYWQRPDATAKSIRDGWYFPGDLAVADSDGDLWVAGRVDDMINSGGENLYPDEIEDALVRCDAVREVVVVGLPDDRWGQAATAFFVPDGHAGAEDAVAALDTYVRERSGLPSMKRPKRLVAVATIPKSGVGKILRRELADGRYQALADSGSGTRPDRARTSREGV